MESYIVRVYRRAGTEAGGIVGTVNNVATQESKAFKTVDELWKALNEAVAVPLTGAETRRAGDRVKQGGGPRRPNVRAASDVKGR
jgi:hypothetical protein